MEGREAALDSEADGKEEHEQNDSPALVACGKSRKTHTFRRKKKKRESVVVLNVVDTKYEIVRHVGKNILGWKLCRESQVSKNWDVYWTDSAIRTEFLAKLEKYQKVNHFPGMVCIHRKNNLARNLMRMAKRFPQEYSFFPKTYLLPSDYHEFASQFQGKLKTFIIKPEGSAQGRGIFLVQTADQVPSDEQLIAQKYVTKPYLLDGLKFDLRVYVLVAGCDPLRVYVYKDGLARFATSDYCPPSKKNLANTFMHLTNYAINKHNPEFKENAIDGEKEEGHKKSLRFVFDRMKAQGVDIDEVWKQIKLIAVKTLCVAQPQLAHCYHTAQPDDQHNHMCFELLGLDILITSDGRPLLLEVNHTPSFSTGSPLDSQVKGSCIADCLRIMRVSTDSRAALVSLEKKARQARVFTGKRARLGRTERGTALAELQRERDEYVRQHLGNFEEAFPCAESFHDEPVEAFLKAALEEYELATGVVSRKECASPLSPLHGGLAASLHMRSASVVEEKVATGKAGAKDDSKVEARFRQPNQPAHARPSEMPPHAFYSYTRATSNEQVSPSSRPAYHIALPTSVKSKKSSAQLKHLQQSVSHSSFKHKDESVRERDTSKTEGHLDRLIESTTGTRLAEKNIVQRGSLLFKKTTPMVNIEMVFLLHPALEFQKRWTSACCPQRSSVPSRPLARHHAY